MSWCREEVEKEALTAWQHITLVSGTMGPPPCRRAAACYHACGRGDGGDGGGGVGGSGLGSFFNANMKPVARRSVQGMCETERVMRQPLAAARRCL